MTAARTYTSGIERHFVQIFLFPVSVHLRFVSSALDTPSLRFKVLDSESSKDLIQALQIKD